MDDLRGEVQKILAGRTDGGGSVDPFNERNEWEDAKRSGKAPKAAQLDKPKSRRAQQAQAREAAKPVDPKVEAEKAAKASAKAAQNRRPQPVNVPAEASWKPKPNGGPVLLPVCATWWEEVAPAAEAEAERASDEQLRQWRVQAEALYERELGAFASRQEKMHGADHRMVRRLLTLTPTLTHLLSPSLTLTLTVTLTLTRYSGCCRAAHGRTASLR